MDNQKIKGKDFLAKILNGTAIGIVVGLIPNAILGEIFKALLPYGNIFKTLYFIVVGVQFSVPLLIGALVASQFKFTPPEIAVLAFVAFIGSGILNWNEGVWAVRGIGDLINTMLTVSVGALLIILLHGKLGSLTIILLPLICAIVGGGFGVFTLPYVKMITGALGGMIQKFTTLQPLLMSILLSISFAVIIISPVSTVAIAYAVGLTGLASGAGNIGIASCAMTLVVASLRVNKIGVTLAVFLGSMKLFMPNWIKHPIINIPIIINAIFAGILAWLFNIQGTPASCGFGFSGLVGPINAYKFMSQSPGMRVLILFVAYFVLTFAFAFLTDFLFVKIIKLYKRDVFVFEQK